MFEIIEKVLKRKRRPVWIKPWFKNRLRTSAYQKIFQELPLKDKEEYRRHLNWNLANKIICLFIRLFIYFDIILRIEKLLKRYLFKIFIVTNISIMLMELFDFIYHEKYYLDHGSTKIITINSPHSISKELLLKDRPFITKKLRTCDCRFVSNEN